MTETLRDGMINGTAPDKISDQAKATYPGQAHWGGSGPRGKTCRECTFWALPERDAYFAGSDLLKDQSCNKAKAMMNLVMSPKVPPLARACKYFAPRENPPPLSRATLDQQKSP
jgi:hypothetical protein